MNAGTTRSVLKNIITTLDQQNRFLRKISGVIHVGANTGQERDLYAHFDLQVIWIEPIQTVYEQLCSNLTGYPYQKAYRRLITDRDDYEYDFHIASNNGASSSVFPFSKHAAMWPDISICNVVPIRSTTLTSFVRNEQIDLDTFQGLVLDTQGSELLVLKGAKEILPAFRFVKLEASSYEAYANGCQESEVADYMHAQSFWEVRRRVMKSMPAVGTYWDIVYQGRGQPAKTK